MFLAAN